MMNSISMKVNPLYSEIDLSIQFHFEFLQGDCKVGEALASTYPIENHQQALKPKHLSFPKVEKCAVIDLFDVVGDLEKGCLNKLHHFLKVIGMKEVHAGYDIQQGSMI
ncbi:hypothetical protein M1I95_02025 [Rossellomorea marisflavi]|jgi:hypothetical protein|uniref:hypothetical protein n=2 Tax=Rossellomorea TaxID=2837508 RepID=UPI0027A41085|nr:hypothetical protein [Rossellomorea marisflavi]UTE73349.1 hypothetical protein M1I95_02025 [Rossellomorea marisflavi]